MGREARVRRNAPRGAVENPQLRMRVIPASIPGKNVTRMNFTGRMNFSDRSYHVRPDGQLRRLSPEFEEKR